MRGQQQCTLTPSKLRALLDTAIRMRDIVAFQLENMTDAKVAQAKATQLDPSPRQGNG